jgi:transcription elongation factor Elf1
MVKYRGFYEPGTKDFHQVIGMIQKDDRGDIIVCQPCTQEVNLEVKKKLPQINY